MQFLPTELPGVVLIEPKIFSDDRGYFLETFQAERFRAAGLPANFVQDNHSRSKRGVLRGLHYQMVQPQGKLVRTVRGEIFDVAVDMRRSSPNFGRWVGVTLSDTNCRQLYVPPGFAHGFCALSEFAEIVYKCTDLYHPQSEATLLWNDPQVNIAWPISQPLLSPKDQQGRSLTAATAYD